MNDNIFKFFSPAKCHPHKVLLGARAPSLHLGSLLYIYIYIYILIDVVTLHSTNKM